MTNASAYERVEQKLTNAKCDERDRIVRRESRAAQSQEQEHHEEDERDCLGRVMSNSMIDSRTDRSLRKRAALSPGGNWSSEVPARPARPGTSRARSRWQQLPDEPEASTPRTQTAKSNPRRRAHAADTRTRRARHRPRLHTSPRTRDFGETASRAQR